MIPNKAVPSRGQAAFNGARDLPPPAYPGREADPDIEFGKPVNILTSALPNLSLQAPNQASNNPLAAPVPAAWEGAPPGSYVLDDKNGITIAFGTSLTIIVEPQYKDALTDKLNKDFPSRVKRKPAFALASEFANFDELHDWLRSKSGVPFLVRNPAAQIEPASQPRALAAHINPEASTLENKRAPETSQRPALSASSSHVAQPLAPRAALPLILQSLGRSLNANNDTQLIIDARDLGEMKLVNHLTQLLPLLHHPDPEVVREVHDVIWKLNKNLDSVFMWAVRRNYASAVRIILASLAPELQCTGKDAGRAIAALSRLGMPNDQCYTALTVAAKFACADVADALLETLLSNRDPSVLAEAFAILGHTTGSGGNTSMIWVFGKPDAQNGVTHDHHVAVADVFLKHLVPLLSEQYPPEVRAQARAVIEHRNAKGASALTWAATGGFAAQARTLRALGAPE